MKNNKAKISIITATYNRDKYIKRLYNSICNQKYNDVEWIIVDDGSDDSTEKVVEELINEKQILIKYVNKTNGGKHTAINIGINETNSDLSFIVDSDDIVADGALDKINKIWEETRDNKNIIGIGGLKKNFNNQIIGNNIPTDKYLDASMIEITYRYKVSGDKSIIFKSSILKKNKFPEFENEKFLTEAVLYNRITDDKNKIRWSNEVFNLCEYLDDGLTNKYDYIMANNWNGTNLYFRELLNLNIDDKSKGEIIKEYLKYSFINKKFKHIIKKYSVRNKYKLIGLNKGIILFLKIKIKGIIKNDKKN